MRDVIARIVDGSKFREFKKEYGPTIITVRLQSVVSYLVEIPPYIFTGFREYPRLPRRDSGKQRHPILPICTQSNSLHRTLLAKTNTIALFGECNRLHGWLESREGRHCERRSEDGSSSSLCGCAEVDCHRGWQLRCR